MITGTELFALKAADRAAGGWGGGVRSNGAFTLLEVMIALAIFFMAIFAILESTSRSLGSARALQLKIPDATSLVADLTLTNRLEEGVIEGDFGDLHPGCTWTRETYQVATNGLFQVDFTIHWFNGKRPVESRTSILLWRPESAVSATGRSLHSYR